MESYFSISYPSLPFFLPSEKLIFMESMEDVLSNTQPHSPFDWSCLVQQHDPNGDYVVTAVHHYKERRLTPNLQHEYVTLSIEQRLPPDGHEPMAVILSVSRTITNHTLPAWIGLWGPADDTVAVRGPADQFQPDDVLLHHLLLPRPTAPSLRVVSHLISQISFAMPRYHLIRSSCYSFALAVRRTIELIYDGVNGARRHHHDFLVHESHLLRIIPTPTTRALKTAWSITRLCLFMDGRIDASMR